MSISLTEGAVPKLWSGEVAQLKMTPVVQVVDLRLLNTKDQAYAGRYRAQVSDGLHMLHVILDAQLDHWVDSEMLQKGSVIKITSFSCHEIQNRMIVIVAGVDLIRSFCHTIGNPQPLSVCGISLAGNSEAGHNNSSLHTPQTSLSGCICPQSSYQRPPPPKCMNKGPVAENEATPGMVSISALNSYQGMWTIKARVTAKRELRFYINPRGNGKVFSFDLLDSDGGEIRVTCFNTVADQFYNQIEAGKVYLISKGTLKPAQKTFNHLRNDYEIVLDNSSTVQLCYEDAKTIPLQQFHFQKLCDIEGMENNTIVDVVGVVCSVSSSSSIMRRSGTETQRRILQLKDVSGRSIELILWGNFCNVEGQTLQDMCDSGVFPVLAVKSGRVNDFIGKSVGTISTSQLLIEPAFPETYALRTWFDQEGKSSPSISISRKTTNMTRADIRGMISQIKDEKLGTSGRPDWITVGATLSYINMNNFCYTACPIMVGDRKCSKKVTNNGDGRWWCDQFVDECDYRYILSFQIQDYTGSTWVTAFQECGEEIMGISAKDLYYLKYEEHEDEKFEDIVHDVLFTRYIFKMKVEEETFGDEQRVKSTVVKAERVDFASETLFHLDFMDQGYDSSSVVPATEHTISNVVQNSNGFLNPGSLEHITPIVNNAGGRSNLVTEIGMPINQVGLCGYQYSRSQIGTSSFAGMPLRCNGCGSAGPSYRNCPSVMNGQGQFYGGGFDNRVSPEAVTGGASGKCFKCHQSGHWVKNCPNLNNAPPVYGSVNSSPGRLGNTPKQHGGF